MTFHSVIVDFGRRYFQQMDSKSPTILTNYKSIDVNPEEEKVKEHYNCRSIFYLSGKTI